MKNSKNLRGRNREHRTRPEAESGRIPLRLKLTPEQNERRRLIEQRKLVTPEQIFEEGMRSIDSFGA